MSEKFKRENMIGGKLSAEDVNNLLKKYNLEDINKLNDKGERTSLLPENYHGVSLELDPEHSEFFKIGNTRLQKLKTIGFGADDKPKPIAVRIEELLGRREEKWSKLKHLNPAAE